MNIDILHIIKRILLSDQTVSVPGLGVFYLKRVPAQVDKIRNEFYPPSAEIQFKLKSETRGDRLIQALIDEFGLDKQAALQAINDYIRWIWDQLDIGERVDLQGLGSLYKDDNDNLIFDGDEADPVFVSSSYPTFTLDPVVRKSKEDIARLQHTLDQKAPIVKPVKEKSGVGIQHLLPFLLMLMVAGGIYGLYRWNVARGLEPTVELMSIDESRLNKTPVIDTPTTALDESPEKTSDVSHEEIKPEAVEDNIEPPHTEPTEEDKIEVKTPEIETAPIEKAIKKPEIKSSVSDNCVIIVGAFGSASNVSKMLRKIEGLGLAGYQDNRLSTLTRVGVKADCASINQVLNQVKNQIEPSAWILE